uniref:Uncharacterized protein n=1 Tax=Zea mays TaxID=4577 RepID=C4J7X7_MAIZE|nr:unknown [Zea mays]ACR37349.1 unknown [Zea mays]
MQLVRCAWPRKWPPAPPPAVARSGAGIARRHGARLSQCHSTLPSLRRDARGKKRDTRLR